MKAPTGQSICGSLFFCMRQYLHLPAAPFIFEDGHKDSVSIAAIGRVDCSIAEHAFLNEARLLVDMFGPGIVGEDVEGELMQMELGEGVIDRLLHSPGAYAMPKIARIEDRYSEVGAARFSIDLTDHGLANDVRIRIEDHEILPCIIAEIAHEVGDDGVVRKVLGRAGQTIHLWVGRHKETGIFFALLWQRRAEGAVIIMKDWGYGRPRSRDCLFQLRALYRHGDAGFGSADLLRRVASTVCQDGPDKDRKIAASSHIHSCRRDLLR